VTAQQDPFTVLQETDPAAQLAVLAGEPDQLSAIVGAQTGALLPVHQVRKCHRADGGVSYLLRT
jgi:hypothetical protein